MRPIAVFSLIVLLLAVTAVSVQAQLQLTIDELDDSGFPEIVLKVHVTEDGSNARHLDVENFIVLEDGVIQPITEGYCEDTLSRVPVSVLLLFDISRSMGPWPFGNNGLVDAKRAAKLFIDRLASDDSVAVVSFSDQVYYDQPWTNDKALLKRKIDDLQWLGATALWDGVATSANLIRYREQRRIMIVLADGDDNVSDLDANTAINYSISANCTVYTIGLGSQVDDTNLRLLAASTGGRYYIAPTSSDLDQIYAEINQELQSSGICELRYVSPIDCWNGSDVAVEVRVNTGGRNASASSGYMLPYDTTTFSYVNVAMNRDYVVEAGERITIPVQLTRVSPARAPSVFEFSVDFDTDLLQLVSAETGTLVSDYSVTTVPTLRGSDVRLLGGNPVTTPGQLCFLTFEAAPLFSSAKTEIRISPPEVQQFCTVATSDDGLITVSGTCERALQQGSGSLTKTQLLGGMPNPFRDGTLLRYRVAEDEHVTIRISNMMGETVATLVDGPATAGEHSVRFDASGLPSGRYFVMMISSSGMDQMGVVLAK